MGGIYGLSNAQAWIYIHAADNIRAALLDHVDERNPGPDFLSVTGFTFELCDTAERSQGCSRLIGNSAPSPGAARYAISSRLYTLMSRYPPNLKGTGLPNAGDVIWPGTPRRSTKMN